MRINPEEFFKFCARQVPLLRDLAERSGKGDFSESEIQDLVLRHAGEFEEQPSFVARELKRLSIIAPLEEGQEFYLMTEPVAKLLQFLLAEAKPVSSQTVQGHIDFLQELCQRLRRGLEIDDAVVIELALGDITQELRRLHDGVGTTNTSVLQEVAR